MSTMTSAVQAPLAVPHLLSRTAPSVNLLPPEIAEGVRFRRARAGLVVGVVLTAGAVGALYVTALWSTAAADRDLQTVVAEGAGLQTDIAGLAEVDVVLARAAGARAMLAQAMGREVRYSTLLSNVTTSLPEDVWLTSVSFTQADPAAAAAATPDAAAGGGAPTGIGSASLTGVGFSHDDVADWLDGLAEQRAYRDPYLTDSTAGRTGDRTTVSFSSTVTLTEAAMSGRYTTRAD